MSPSKLAVLSLATLLSLGAFAALADDPPKIVVDPAIATMTVDQKVEARQHAMKEDGGLLKGARTLSGDAAAEAATRIIQNFTNFPALFADGATNSKSEAEPLIWTEFDKFTAIFDKGRTAAEDMRAAALAGDNDKYLASFKTLAGVCGECHGTYRLD
jgi:cytochrome c556